MQTLVVSCCVLLVMVAGGVWTRDLDEEELMERAASADGNKGLTADKAGKIIATAMQGLDKLEKSSGDAGFKAELNKAKAGLAQDLQDGGKEVKRDSNLGTRAIPTSIRLGRNWRLGLGGLQYQSRNNRFRFNVSPTLSGFRTSFKWRF